jgi:hypothetical protein
MCGVQPTLGVHIGRVHRGALEYGLAVGKYQPAGMIRVQVRQQHIVDPGRISVRCGQIGWQMAGDWSQ